MSMASLTRCCFSVDERIANGNTAVDVSGGVTMVCSVVIFGGGDAGL
jgi:hypothetical protein